jgi:hypothetical protein
VIGLALFLITGSILLLLSLLSLSFILRLDRSVVEEFISWNIKSTFLYGVLFAMPLFFVWLSELWYVIEQNDASIVVRDYSFFALWMVLIYINISLTRRMIQNGYRPGINRDFINLLFYLPVMWFLFERVDFPWQIVVGTTTIFTVMAFYFLVEVRKYRKVALMIVQPVSLYTPAIGIRIFSSLLGLDLMAREYSENAFRGFIVLAYAIFTVILWYVAKEIGKLAKDFEI